MQNQIKLIVETDDEIAQIEDPIHNNRMTTTINNTFFATGKISTNHGF